MAARHQSQPPPNVYIEKASLFYQQQPIFTDVTLTLFSQQWVGLIGQSGVGKSSLIRMIAGLVSPPARTQGKIYVDNTHPLSAQIAFMAQTDLLLPWFTVLNNALLGCKLKNHSKKNHLAMTEKAKNLLTQVGLGHALQHYPHQLSGGMRQRVALVRTLMENKPIILMDEPFSALDAITRYDLQNLAANLLQDKTVFFITHDPWEALRLSHEIYIMQGKPARIKALTQLTTPTPRDVSDPNLLSLHQQLLETLRRGGRCN